MKSHIVRPQMLGGDQFDVGKDLAGNFTFTINRQSIKMTPSQVHDLACRLLTALGHQIEVVDQAANSMPGPRLVG